MTQFSPPPTYAEPVIVNERTGKFQFNPIWLKWFIDIAAFVSSSGGGSGGGADHESLTGLLGGGVGEHYHFTAADYAALVAGFTVGATLKTSNANKMVQSTAAFTDGAGAAVGTLNNAPAAGNPTKWISIDDNGTTRKIPAW